MSIGTRWLRVVLAATLVVACLLPQVASARGKKGPSPPFVMTANGLIRQSDYYAHLLTPEQRAVLRAGEDEWIANGMKPPKKGTKTKPTTPATPKKK